MKYLKKYKNYIKENLNPEEIENLKKLISTGNMDDIDLALLIASGHPEIENKVKGFVCEQLEIKNYTINENGFIDVDGDVIIVKPMEKLPIKLGKVNGDFLFYSNPLSTLENCPDEVTGDFVCAHSNLTSLKGAPKKIDGNFVCSYNQLTSLEHLPEIGKSLLFSYNKITSLEGCPKVIGGDFSCKHNKLASLKGCPDVVAGTFDCSFNQLTSIDYCPKEIGVGLYCNNNLITLVGQNFSRIRVGTKTRTGVAEFNFKDNPIYEIYRTLAPGFENFRKSMEWNYFAGGNKIFRSRFQEVYEVLWEEYYSDNPNIKKKRKVFPQKIRGYEYI
jgi:hypothetical protein